MTRQANALSAAERIESAGAGETDAGLRFEAWLDETQRVVANASRSSERRRLLAIIASAREVIASQRAEIARLERLSTVDELTDVYNWRGFDWQLRACLDECRRMGRGGVLIYVDLDGFKLINDRYGHAAGNLVLQDVAAALSMNVRKHDSVGRLGGDEFAALLVRTEMEQGTVRAREIERAINEVRTIYAGKTIPVAASVGVVPVRLDDTAERVLERADCEMYSNKRARAASLRPLARGSVPPGFGLEELLAP